MGYVCITLVVCNTVGEMFLVCGSYKLEFRTCLNSQFAWRLALDNVEQSQSSYVIIDLGQERYAEKPITYIPLQVFISNTFMLPIATNIPLQSRRTTPHQGWQNLTRPANSTRHDTKLADYGLRLNGFMSYSG